MTSISGSKTTKNSFVPSLVKFLREDAAVLVSFTLFLCAFYWSLTQIQVGFWKPYLGDGHGFRQAQTAITVEYLLRGGPWFKYETPVLGAPWSIPFEFPLYQWIVAITVKLTGWDVAPAGRFVSAGFFYGSLPFLWLVLAELGTVLASRWFFLAIMTLAPSYLFWSRTIMIESTAFFFSVGYFYFALRYLKKFKSTDAVSAAVFGAFAGLVKVTTFFGFLFASLLIVLSQLWPQRMSLIAERKKVIKLWWPRAVPLAMIPVAVTLVWTRFADYQKAKNPFANGFITSGALKHWNYGTFHQRFSMEAWLERIPGMLYEAYGDIWYLGLVFALSVAVFAFFKDRKRFYYIIGSLFCFLAVFMTFTNLHWVHNYYQYADAVFLLAAAAFAVDFLLAHFSKQMVWILCLSILMSIMWSQQLMFQRVYMPLQREEYNWQRYDFLMYQFVREHTPEEDVILMYGADWSSEFPYLMKRRAIMDNFDREVDNKEFIRSLELLKDDGKKIGAVVNCRGPSDKINRVLKALDFSLQDQFKQERACLVYLPNTYLKGKLSI